jgi:hypothetical protein
VVSIPLVDCKLHHLNETDFLLKNNLCLFLLVEAKVIKKVAMENHIRKLFDSSNYPDILYFNF